MNTIITIARQFGSGGHEIGEKVAQRFDIKFYDKELLTRVAKESGFCEEMIECHDERPTNSFLYNLVMDTYSFGYSSAAFSDMPWLQRLLLYGYAHQPQDLFGPVRYHQEDRPGRPLRDRRTLRGLCAAGF